MTSYEIAILISAIAAAILIVALLILTIKHKCKPNYMFT